RAPNRLYANNGDGTFSSFDQPGMTDYGGYCHNAAWVDYDNDGYLDVFVTDYMPTKFNLLYHNNGDGTFTKQENNSMVQEAMQSMGATWGDYNGDGLQDVFIPNGDNANNSLYRNEGNGQFTKIGSGAIVNDAGNSTGCSWGDYDNDGDLDLYVTNASDQLNFFYENDGDGTFTRRTDLGIVQDMNQSHSSAWADLDNDGDLDLFVANNAARTNKLFINDGEGDFFEVENAITEDMESSMAAAWSDVDNDGDMDLFVANSDNQENSLYVNSKGACNSWKCFRLEGTQSNRSAVGAVVRVKATIYGKSVWQMRYVSTQSGGISAQSTMRAMFGLGDASLMDSVIVEWPSGYVQYYTYLGVNDCMDIVEEQGQRICGTVFLDENQNCVLDSTERVIPNQMIRISPGEKYITTNDRGEYIIYRAPGTYTLEFVSRGDWSPSCVSSHVVTLSAQGGQDIGGQPVANACDKNFPLSTGCSDADLSLTMSSTVLRRGFRNTYAITYGNNGPQDATGVTLEVDFPNEIIPLSANIPWTSYSLGDSTTRYSWTTDTVKSFSARTIIITDSVSATAALNKLTETRASLTSGSAECEISDNSYSDFNRIAAPIDPNDILVFPEGAIMPQDSLQYKIRFQNVGNNFATHVIILDTLDQGLDISSIEIGASSHPFEWSISEDRVLRFRFPYAMLPDSNSNEPESHGFVQYKIKPNREMPLGTRIENRAAIQFDFNDFIITNTVVTTLADTRVLAAENKLEVQVNPNPINDMATVQIVSKDDANVRVPIVALGLFNATGVEVLRMNSLNSESVQINRGDIPPGVYVVRVFDRHGFKYSTKVVIK
ncbi:MAG: FG-GAP-like repeat-containing protein, partial [Bacteroidota bacterium]